MKINLRTTLVLPFLLPSLWLVTASGADVFLHETAAKKGIAKEDAAKVTELVKAAIQESGKHQVVTDQRQADIFLQPRLSKGASGYTITLERKQFSKFTGAFPVKAKNPKEFDQAARKAVQEALSILSGGEPAQ